ncbi:MAG: hypothetical protein KAI25_03230, partial [Hyphomicrobiaceae bacterium]|nr:hypothetical protein [Hyphomicrobiaceae bacterium]
AVSNPSITADYGVPGGTVALNPNTGYRKVGDTVTITVTATGNETGLTASDASLNSEDIVLDDNDTNGTYIGIYTLEEGDADSTNTNATGITLTDPAGNVSSALSSSGSTLIIDANSPKLFSAIGTGSGTAGLFNAIGDQLDLVFNETIKTAPSESDSETNFEFTVGDGNNFPTQVGGDTIIALTTTLETNNNTITYTFSEEDTANTNLINMTTMDVDVNVGSIVPNSIEDLAGNDLIDTTTGIAVDITEIDKSPNAPTLVSPPDMGYLSDTTPTVTWNVPTDPNADNLDFIVYFDEVNTFNSGALRVYDSSFGAAVGFSPAPTYPHGVGTVSYTVQDLAFLDQGTWYWRVVAKDVNYYISVPSNTWSMVVDTVNPTPDVTTDSNPIFDGDLLQIVTVSYGESMDNGTVPEITFTGGNWGSQTGGVWSTVSNTDDTYTANFTHNGTSEYNDSEAASVASASGAKDLAGNDENSDSSTVFVVDTQNPVATVTFIEDPIISTNLTQT